MVQIFRLITSAFANITTTLVQLELPFNLQINGSVITIGTFILFFFLISLARHFIKIVIKTDGKSTKND